MSNNYSKPFDPSKPVVVSTGPTSDAGKAVSSKNARKHGCCALLGEKGETSLLDTESAEDFKALEATWLKSYNPATEAERHLVAELVNADWLLQRTTQTYLKIETRLYTESPNPLDWTEQQQRTLGRFLRYRTAHFNTVAKCRKAIEDHRKALVSEKTKLEKLKTQEKKNQPEPSWKDHLEAMRQQAIALGYTPPEPDPTL